MDVILIQTLKEEYVPFDLNWISDGAHCSLFTPSSFPSKIRIGPLFYPEDQKERMGQHSCHTRASNLDLIYPLPDYQMYYNSHSLQYDKNNTCSDKSSACNNYTTTKVTSPRRGTTNTRVSKL